MDGGIRGIDPLKIQTIRECLDKQFLGVEFSQTIRPTFTFHNGVPKLPWLLVINAEFLADRMSIEELTFPRFHRHLYKEEPDEIGGQDEHQDQTAVYGRV